MQITIPDKLYFKIGEVAKMAEVPTHVIRYWESEFVAIKPKRANSKQRLFRRHDVELILKIKSLLHHKGFTIAGAKKVLESGEEINLLQKKEKVSTPEVSLKLQKLKQELKQIHNLLSEPKE